MSTIRPLPPTTEVINKLMEQYDIDHTTALVLYERLSAVSDSLSILPPYLNVKPCYYVIEKINIYSHKHSFDMLTTNAAFIDVFDTSTHDRIINKWIFSTEKDAKEALNMIEHINTIQNYGQR